MAAFANITDALWAVYWDISWSALEGINQQYVFMSDSIQIDYTYCD